MSWLWLPVLLVGAASAYALRPELAGSLSMWGSLLGVYAALAGLALVRLRRGGRLAAMFRYRSGDLSVGVLVAVGLLAASWLGRARFAPLGTDRYEWLQRLYEQVGDPKVLQASFVMTGCLLVLAVLEELVWRGLVLTELTSRVGPRLAWPLAALLYATAQLPTLWTLSSPGAGLNPLVFFAALGSGLVWSYLVARTGRITAAVLSHVVFTYFSAVQFQPPGF